MHTKLAQEFTDGWKHYLNCINFGASTLDAQAIRFMNEMPAKILQRVNNFDDLLDACKGLVEWPGLLTGGINENGNVVCRFCEIEITTGKDHLKGCPTGNAKQAIVQAEKQG